MEYFRVPVGLSTNYRTRFSARCPVCLSTAHNWQHCSRVPKTGGLGQRGHLGNGDHDFAVNMAGLDMTNSFCDFAQRVDAVDNGNHGSSLD
jgi:hypothetical protein